MSIDPYYITCPYCMEGRAFPHSTVPDEYDDDRAYSYPRWTCDRCGKSGFMTIRWVCMSVRVENDQGEPIREEACE